MGHLPFLQRRARENKRGLIFQKNSVRPSREHTPGAADLPQTRRTSLRPLPPRAGSLLSATRSPWSSRSEPSGRGAVPGNPRGTGSSGGASVHGNTHTLSAAGGRMGTGVLWLAGFFVCKEQVIFEWRNEAPPCPAILPLIRRPRSMEGFQAPWSGNTEPLHPSSQMAPMVVPPTGRLHRTDRLVRVFSKNEFPRPGSFTSQNQPCPPRRLCLVGAVTSLRCGPCSLLTLWSERRPRGVGNLTKSRPNP